jgi:hypothetical protein
MRGQGSVPTRAANTFNHDVIQPINRDVIRPVAHFAADFGQSVWHFGSEFAQGVGNVFTGLIRGIGCIGSFGSPAAGTCNNAAANQINQGNGQIWRGGGGLCLDLCPVKGGKYLAKIPIVGRAIDRIGHWIKPGETAAQRSARYTPETAGSDWPELSGVLRDAAKGKGNFGLGSATQEQAGAAGRAWVGDGASLASDGKTWISQDGLRQFRAPSYKPNLDQWQANFESRLVPRGAWQGNGHLDITDPP